VGASTWSIFFKTSHGGGEQMHGGKQVKHGEEKKKGVAEGEYIFVGGR